MTDRPNKDKNDSFIKDFFDQQEEEKKANLVKKPLQTLGDDDFIKGVFDELNNKPEIPKKTASAKRPVSKPIPQRPSKSKSKPNKKSQAKPAAKPKSKSKTKLKSAASKKKKSSFFPFKKKGSKNKKKPTSKVRRIVKYGLLACLALFLAAGIYTGVVVANTSKMIKDISYDSIYDYLSQRSTIYDDEGKKLESLSTEGGNRDIIQFDELPKHLKDGIVAIEDKTFWEHHGFNFIRMAGAVKNSILGGGQIGGTSTISQQLARNIYLAKSKTERSLSRKIAEAYITVKIENSLEKEQILEAYLNTIYLGFDTYGVEAASHAYFNKSVKTLDLLESAALCALPKSPDAYALVKSYDTTVSADRSDILDRTDSMTYVYNGDHPDSKGRREFTIKSMVEQGRLSKEEADTALGQDLRNKMDVKVSNNSEVSSYFNDYVIKQVTEDIMNKFQYNEEEAKKRLYTGGLQIHTTLNKNMQEIIEKNFKETYGYPSVVNLKKDKEGNIVGRNNNVLLYDYNSFFDQSGSFTLKKSEYNINSNGSITLYAGKRLTFPNVETSTTKDINVDFKGLYIVEDKKLYTIENGTLSIPPGAKSKDAQGNCIIEPEFMEKQPNFFKKKGNKLQITRKNYTIKQKVIQPQSAMVITDLNGGVKAMVGGRNIEGKRLYNRAMNPRQPGSSIKPISVYATGLQSGYLAAQAKQPQTLTRLPGDDWGKYITAGSVINDAPINDQNGDTWPKNWYNAYKGRMTLRYAVEQSVNVCAVKVFNQTKADPLVSQLNRLGVTSVVETGRYNDMNAAALALGGMTKGISPLEMASAYSVFPNKGKHEKSRAYTKILDSQGEEMISKSEIVGEPDNVMDEGVAFIMTDLLHSAVEKGTGKDAKIKGQPVAGKTGTTSDNYDAWFVGFTPQYSAALWIGNDVNIELDTGSSAAAELWSRIMEEICKDIPTGQFPPKPGEVVFINGEYYIEGTYEKILTNTTPTTAAGESSSGKGDNKTDAATDPTTTAPSQTSGPSTNPSTMTDPPSSTSPTTSPPTTEDME